jgi:hydrogenase expression/formation protein HypE
MSNQTETINCPTFGYDSTDRIMLAHGEGGRLMRQLIRQRILPVFDNEFLQPADDAAILPGSQGRLAMTTDSFVVSPLFFPGGDIGSLAIYGTVNDLAVAGAQPHWISLGLILEEGLEISILERVLKSAATAANRVGVQIVTGDTKIVPRGAVDKLFINTTGVGELFAAAPGGPQSLQVGDQLIVTGPIGRHGIAVMAARESLNLDPPPQSDSAPLLDAVQSLQRANISFRSARDATRGGLGAVLHEWADASGKTLVVRESELPVTADVRGACEILGLDPIHVANEGTMLIAIPRDDSERAVCALRSVREAAHATCIGRVEPRTSAPVVVERGTRQLIPLDEPIGAPLPRIC